MSYSGSLSAELVSESSIRLSWKALEGCESYHVFFRRENNSYKKINTTTGLSVVISGVDTSALCRFRVCGVDKIGRLITVGETDNSAMIKPVKLLTMGSVNLEIAFDRSARLKADNKLRKLSPFSVFFPNKVPDCDLLSDMDLVKTAGDYLSRSDAEYFVLDFYGSVVHRTAKWNDTFVTETEEFLKSEYFNSHKEYYERLPLYLPEDVVKPLMDIFAAKLLSRFSHDKIILVRFALPKYYSVDKHIRVGGSHSAVNDYIKRLEDMFIGLVHPVVADISHGYFSDNERSTRTETVMDRFYFARLAKLVEDVVKNGVAGYYNDGEDINIQFDRLIYYYDSAMARGFYNVLFDKNSAAGKIMMQTSREFVCENRELLMDITRRGWKTIHDAYVNTDCGDNRTLKRTLKVLTALERGKLSAVSFSDVLDVMKKNERIRRPLQKAVGAELEKNLGRVIVITEKNFVFLLKAAYDMWSGVPIDTVGERVDEYLKICAQIPVDIWGSCVSREPMNRSTVACVDKYIFKNSPVWAFDEPIPISDGFFDNAERFGSVWRRTMTEEVFMRKAPDMIRQGIGKWVIVDFYDLSSQMARYRGGCFAVDNFIMRSDYFADISGETELFFLDAQKDEELILSAVDKTAKLLSEKYGGRIILNRVRLNDRYRDMDGNISPLASTETGNVRTAQKVVNMSEERFIEKTGCYVIDVTKHCISDDSFPLGGAHPAHYEEIYYLTAAAYVDYIVREQPKQRIFDKM